MAVSFRQLVAWLDILTERTRPPQRPGRESALGVRADISKAAVHAFQWLELPANRALLSRTDLDGAPTWDGVCHDFIHRAKVDLASLSQLHVSSSGTVKLDPVRAASLQHVEAVLGWAHEGGPVLVDAPVDLLDLCRVVLSHDVAIIVAGA